MIDLNKIDFQKGNGLVPVIVQDAVTQKVLMLGYADEKALRISIESGKLTFFSRTRNAIWTKGQESGNFLIVQNLSLDCDNDTILASVIPIGTVCHTGADTCWGEENTKSEIDFVSTLESVIAQRKTQINVNNSYVSALFAKGINKIAQKVGEEAIELIIESKDDNPTLFLNEAADFFFHYLILLQAKGHKLSDVVSTLRRRHYTSSD
jgi:phosphoribosyl-ATP pyrophosphohydrolase/phosphoribosyl-AMP cyclohydrolase